MAKFILVNICDEKKIGKYSSSCFWKECKILPYYQERYICFASNEDF